MKSRIVINFAFERKITVDWMAWAGGKGLTRQYPFATRFYGFIVYIVHHFFFFLFNLCTILLSRECLGYGFCEPANNK